MKIAEWQGKAKAWTVIEYTKNNNTYFQNLSQDDQQKYIEEAEEVIHDDYYDDIGDFKANKYIESHIATTAFNID